MGRKSSRLKNLRKIDEAGRVMPGKISEMILDFARPLLDEMGEPRSLDDLRNAFLLVTICWNLPVFEKVGGPSYENMRRQLDHALTVVPKPVVVILERLMHDRKTTFAQIPFYVIAEIRGTTLENCKVHAEAREGPP